MTTRAPYWRSAGGVTGNDEDSIPARAADLETGLAAIEQVVTIKDSAGDREQRPFPFSSLVTPPRKTD
jgi:hypothetical protein